MRDEHIEATDRNARNCDDVAASAETIIIERDKCCRVISRDASAAAMMKRHNNTMQQLITTGFVVDHH